MTKSNPMSTASMKGTVKVGYADYDGGPLPCYGKQVIPSSVLDSLPNMTRFAFTVAKRGRGKNLSYETFIELPDGWKLTRTFNDSGVICSVFDLWEI